MNRNAHTLVFNAARGGLMAVAESAVRCGKAASGQRPVGCARNAARAVLALGLLSAALVQAQIVADPTTPGNQRPTVLTTPNGAPLVNIQTPSAAGVSRNTYQQFDVNSNGAVLNNSRTNVQTQLGGWVQGNPWLATGSARIIVNEVNSTNPSQLRGFIEVAGQRAEVIIANPAGINIDGAGFINASRATLTTGTPLLQGGSLESYRVQRGTISINGAGLDATLTDHTVRWQAGGSKHDPRNLMAMCHRCHNKKSGLESHTPILVATVTNDSGELVPKDRSEIFQILNK